jgi:hypothetical protein
MIKIGRDTIGITCSAAANRHAMINPEWFFIESSQLSGRIIKGLSKFSLHDQRLKINSDVTKYTNNPETIICREACGTGRAHAG